MNYANNEILKKAHEEVWQEQEEESYALPNSDGERSLETLPTGNTIPKVNVGIGISADRFPSVKGADLIY